MHYLIIGNSAAGIFAAETIRGLDNHGKITMISDEDCTPYSRCLTSYYLAGEITENRMYIRPNGFYKDLNIDFLGVRAEKVLTGEHKVVTTNKKEIYYDKLLIATGASPVFPPIEGINYKGVFQLRSKQDVENILGYLSKVKQAVVIGAGLVGLKGAHGLHAQGIKIDIVEFAPQIMPQSLDQKAASLITEVLTENGYKVRLNKKVIKILGEQNLNGEMSVSGVLLDNGEIISCQIVLMATGVRPNIDSVLESEIKINRGIIVNEKMQTSVENIYAAGDVAETNDLIWKENRINALWPTATAQGIIAGSNMVGINRLYEGSLGLNSADFFHIPVVSVGMLNLAPGVKGQEISLIDPSKRFYRKLVLQDGCLVGFIMIGEIKGAGVLKGYISKKVNIENNIGELLNGPILYKGFFPASTEGAKT